MEKKKKNEAKVEILVSKNMAAKIKRKKKKERKSSVTSCVNSLANMLKHPEKPKTKKTVFLYNFLAVSEVFRMA